MNRSHKQDYIINQTLGNFQTYFMGFSWPLLQNYFESQSLSKTKLTIKVFSPTRFHYLMIGFFVCQCVLAFLNPSFSMVPATFEDFLQIFPVLPLSLPFFENLLRDFQTTITSWHENPFGSLPDGFLRNMGVVPRLDEGLLDQKCLEWGSEMVRFQELLL